MPHKVARLTASVNTNKIAHLVGTIQNSTPAAYFVIFGWTGRRSTSFLYVVAWAGVVDGTIRGLASIHPSDPR